MIIRSRYLAREGASEAECMLARYMEKTRVCKGIGDAARSDRLFLFFSFATSSRVFSIGE